MKLSFEDIRNITSGTEYIEKNNEAVEFHRFSKGEEEAYRDSWLSPRTLATAGVKLHFRTDAASLSLKVVAESIGYNTLYAVDVFSNKKLVGQIKNYPDGTSKGDRTKNEYPIGEAEGSFFLGDGEKEIEVYLPWSVKLGIKEISVEGESFVSPVKKEKKCLIYGDSITQGATALSPSNAYAVRIADRLDAEGMNKAIGSEAYFPELLKARSGNFSPDYLIVSYGVNDWVLRTYEEAEEKCREFWKEACKAYPGAKKFDLTPIWYEDKSINAKLGDFDNIEKFIRTVASEFPEVTVIDCSGFIPEDSNLFDDGVHPTDEGFNFFFEGLKEEIEKHI